MSLFCGTMHASTYAAFRPVYPMSLFEGLASLSPGRSLIWDVACGSGQATSSLASIYDHVIGTDLSASQLDNAVRGENTIYVQCNSEDDPQAIEDRLGIKAGSVDLITVAQAVHWFDLERFYANVRHFLSPNGVIAVWCYCWPVVVGKPELTELLNLAYSEVLGDYWAQQHRKVDRQYSDLDFPFERLIDATREPYMWMEVSWTIEGMFGYMESWSAYQSALETLGSDPLGAIRDRIVAAWGTEEVRLVKFPIFILAGRK